MDLLFDLIRLGNAVGASLVFGALIYMGRLHFCDYSEHQKLLYIAFTMYVVATAYGSVEAYSQGTAPGLRVFLFLLANIIAVFTFARYRKSVFVSSE